LSPTQFARQLEKLLHDLALVAPEQIHQPGALRRPSQATQLARQWLLAGGLRLANLLVASRRERIRPQRIQLVGDGVERRINLGPWRIGWRFTRRRRALPKCG
jgi:hypothetical protein